MNCPFETTSIQTSNKPLTGRQSAFYANNQNLLIKSTTVNNMPSWFDQEFTTRKWKFTAGPLHHNPWE